MTKRDDFLVEIHTEELPPKALLKLAQVFANELQTRLQKAELSYDAMQYVATPRRLAIVIQQLASRTPDQWVERKGPALSAAFNAKGEPTPACVGFARSCGVTPSDLLTIKTAQGEWVGYKQQVSGQSIAECMPAFIEEALNALPIPKRMRWGEGETQFVRPVHSVALLFGETIVPATILGCEAGRITYGHRFLAPGSMTIPHAAAYASLLETEGSVLGDFEKRKEKIRTEAIACVRQQLGDQADVLFTSEALLDEVTGLVEWPVALLGHFDAAFLTLPKEVLISSMQDHQRYFPVVDAKGNLMPHFVAISNIKTHDTERIVRGYERVLRARLSDAAFFYETDQKEKLDARVERLKHIVFQAKLGTLFDKAERLSKLAGFVANKSGLDPELVLLSGVAGVLAKTDLTTSMVDEFPELQGVMGYYYAKHQGERDEIALAMKEQYLPRFAGDVLPQHPVSQALAIADRLDTVVGAFGVGHIPTGDKDPFGLRRATVGILRMLIENKMNVDLNPIFQFAINNYGERIENKDALTQVWSFFLERLRAWYQDQGVPADVFASVAALGIMNPFDMHERIAAVQAFKKLSAAETLSGANKRVSNILTKYNEALSADAINPAFFENTAEKELAKQLEVKSQAIASLSQARQYDKVLLQLAELRQPIDDFFDQVMVMADNKEQRENRILLLKKLRALFLQVADIALLQ